MQIGNVFVKLVERKLQSNSKDFQIMLLAGFDPKLTHRTATYVETLSPNHVLTQDEVDLAIEKARTKCSAVAVEDITNDSVYAKLLKIFDANNYPAIAAALAMR